MRALFPILVGGRWGFIDTTGRVAIPPRFESILGVEAERRMAEAPAGGPRPEPADLFMAPGVGPESTWAIAVRYHGKWGLATQRGGTIGDSRYDEIEAYGDGFAAVRLGERWGFVDQGGRLAIAPQFEAVRPFRGGLGLASVDGKWGAIDGAGRFVLAPRFQGLGGEDSVFHDHRALVTMDDKKGYVGRAGNVAVPAIFDDAFPFSEGLAAVVTEGRCGYIDTTGRMVIAQRFAAGAAFHRGLARVRVGTRYGFIDRSGALVAKPEYEEAASFEGGDRAAARRAGRAGVVDRTGRWIEAGYDEWLVIDDSLAVGRVAGRTGVVRRATGALIRPYAWDDVATFSDGLAAVRKRGGRLGFIDPAGSLAIPPRFDEVGRFRHGICKAAAGDTLGYVGRDGAWVWSGRFPGYHRRNPDQGP